MPEWWEQPYRGGRMIDLPGFPRPMYPPDAVEQGKHPSVDGPDVLAYKRTVSRLGRLKWDPDGWDESYSDGFAHGVGDGDVGASGIAGVQRQANVSPASGWIGRRTFNLLRSVKIPQGLPHSGEYAMDAVAQSLLIDAWDTFRGSPIPLPTGTVRAAALAEAKKWIGTKESPAGSNRVVFSEWYGMIDKWCAMFETYCYEVGAQSLGKDSPTFMKGHRFAYVPYILNHARDGEFGLSLVTSPEPGDIVIYDWDPQTKPDHTGIFEKWVSSNEFTALEGNTSIDSNSNGGAVMRRTRSVGAAYNVFFARVREPA